MIIFFIWDHKQRKQSEIYKWDYKKLKTYKENHQQNKKTTYQIIYLKSPNIKNIYIITSYTSISKNNTIKTSAEDLKRYFPKDTKMAK